jgi:hypothetical protein
LPLDPQVYVPLLEEKEASLSSFWGILVLLLLFLFLVFLACPTRQVLNNHVHAGMHK